MKKPQTLAITNFSGRLTRLLNGDINSGFAKFTNSFGYDPFSKPLNLTWLETPTDVTGPINNLPQAGKVLSGSATEGPNVHIIDQGGRWYQVRSSTTTNSNLNSVVAIQSVGGSYLFGTSMEFFGSVVGADSAGNSLGRLYVGADSNVHRVNPDGSADAVVGNNNFYFANVFRPLKPFAGKLIFGNGNTIAAIDSTGTVTSSVISTGVNSGLYSQLNPPFETQTKVLDLEVSTSNDYLIMANSNILQEERLDTITGDISQTFGSQDGKIAYWNGTDSAATAALTVPTYLLSAIQTYFKQNSFFAADTFGTAFNDGSGKILSLPNNKPPLPNAVTTNGNFMTWACPEIVGSARYLSLYYYGSLDQENPAGLYRVLRWTTTQASGFVSKVPLNLLVSNKYAGINAGGTAIATFGLGKHYIGLSSVAGGSLQNFLLSFLITPTGSGTPQSGVYETQTQIFSKRIGISQIRVYTEPTATGNGFQLDLIGSDGNVIDNGTFTYSFAAGSDINTLQGSLERINFNPGIKTTYALGVRITNTGTTNMTIKKIEIDFSEEGQ